MKTLRKWFPLQPLAPQATGAKLAAKKQPPIDPLAGPKQALAGRVVTMNPAGTVLQDGVVYIDQGCFVAVQERAKPAPAGFEGVTLVETGGTLFPGLVELHNHLSYNILPPWSPVPQLFDNRDQWGRHKDYRPLISGPMTVMGEYRDANGRASLVAALVRYVECKCLLGGVTTSQGIMLASNAGIQRFYRGLIRNVEDTGDPALPDAQARIADVEAKDARSFLTRLKKEDSCLLLHLSEGVTSPSKPESAARKHFLALEVAKDQWALSSVFAGIHSVGLLPDDFQVLAQAQASMVWSPLSNLLLYGQTARVKDAKAAGVTIGLGSDWSPTGSKNLLGEMKVAWLYSQKLLNGLFSSRDIVAMATCDAARILKWGGLAGTIAPKARADVLVISGAGDPYDALIHAKETDIQLVMINGVARYGVSQIMKQLAPADQTLLVGGQSRQLYLKQATADPDVAALSLDAAVEQLADALQNLSSLAKQLEKRKPGIAMKGALDAVSPPVWSLALDEIQDRGETMRPRLPFSGPEDFTGPKLAGPVMSAAAPPLSAILKSVRLDALTVADDSTFLTEIEQQPNVPTAIKSALRSLY